MNSEPVTSRGIGRDVGFFTVSAKPTGCCNLKCRFCYQNYNSMPRRGRMKTDVLETLIQRVCEHGVANTSIQWIGGESLAVGVNFYRQCEELIQRYNTRGIYINCPIQSNGTLLDEKWYDFFNENPLFALSVSFEVFEDLHNALRRGRGRFKDNFQLVRNNIGELRKRDIPFGVLTVPEPKTLKTEPRLWIQRVVESGIRQIGLQLSYRRIYAENTQVVEKYVDWLEELFVAQAEHNSRSSKADKLLIRESYYLYNMIMRPQVRYGCCHHHDRPCTDFLVSVDETGAVFAHCDAFMGVHDSDGHTYQIGTIQENPFKEIFRSDKMGEIRGALQEGREKCRRHCAYYSLCRGGCGFFKAMRGGQLSSGYGDPIDGYCFIKIALLSHVVEQPKRETILRAYEHLSGAADLPGYFIKTG